MSKKIANVGNEITWMDIKRKKQLKGKVIKVLDNSVIVDLTIMRNLDSYSLDFENTVVSHKRYEIIK